MFDEKKVCFTAFSVEPGSEELVFYDWLMANYRPTSVSTFYWGGEAIAGRIPSQIEKREIESVSALKPAMLEGYDVIVRHPSTRPDQLPKRAIVTSHTNQFFEHCPAPIIGVTGTKGKGTTVTIIGKILEAANQKAHILGNIGEPGLNKLSEVAAQDYVVYELSSFQLWDIKRSPHIAVVLAVDSDHLDIHRDAHEYREAKAGIAKHQTTDDIVIYHAKDEGARAIAQTSKGKQVAFLEPPAASVSGDNLVIDGRALLPISEIALPGPHNLENICAAVTASWQVSQDRAAITKVLREFQGLEHRLELVAEVKEVKYYNDSFSTNPEAAIAATRSFANPKVLIMGGSPKRADFKELAETIVGTDIRGVIVIGQEGSRIAAALKEAGLSPDKIHQGDSTMNKIVVQGSDLARAGDVVILTPACASFDMFKSYKDRGQQFKSAVAEL